MKRTLNWTGRQPIPQDRFSISVSTTESGTRYFSAEVAGIAALRLDPEARIYVEPYVGTSSMRFSFGTVGARVTPADTLMSEIDAGKGVLFKVLVVDERQNVGRILASATGVRPASEIQEDDRKSLLPVCYRNLGEAIWKMDLEPGAKPLLVLNSQVPELADLIRNDPLFRGAVIPHAVRKILDHVYGNNGEDSGGDDDSDWVADWKQFAESFRQGIELLEDDSLGEALDEVVDIFISRTGWASANRRQREQQTGVIASD